MDIRIITYDNKNRVDNIFQFPFKTTKSGYWCKYITDAIEYSKILSEEINGKIELEWCDHF